jgi:hypothetical protein
MQGGYQGPLEILSQFGINASYFFDSKVVARGGIEPPPPAFSWPLDE